MKKQDPKAKPQDTPETPVGKQPATPPPPAEPPPVFPEPVDLLEASEEESDGL